MPTLKHQYFGHIQTKTKAVHTKPSEARAPRVRGTKMTKEMKAVIFGQTMIQNPTFLQTIGFAH